VGLSVCDIMRCFLAVLTLQGNNGHCPKTDLYCILIFLIYPPPTIITDLIPCSADETVVIHSITESSA
jgi:hypothetical protein